MAADEASKSVVGVMRGMPSGQVDAPQEEGASAEDPPSSQALFWEDFDTRVAVAVTARNPTSDALMEMRGYLAEPLISRSEDPLAWWKTRQMVYEGLTAVVKARISIVATSVASERVFSKTGQIVTERRNRLNPEKVRQIVFLNANLP